MIACVLMVTFLDDFEFLNHYDLLDFFAGAGRMARGGRVLGYHGAAFDISYTTPIPGSLTLTRMQGLRVFDL